MTEILNIYKHRQTGYAIIIIFSFILQFSIYSYTRKHSLFELILLLTIVLICLLLFHSQTVEISKSSIKTTLGVGLIRKSIDIHSIKDSKIVKNRWYAGWGFRMIPGGTMFNVSGLDAVELILKDGKVFRIGTDEPEKLNNAIQNIKKNK